jgi:hypothetical protein
MEGIVMFVKILSQWRRRKEFQSLEVRVQAHRTKNGVLTLILEISKVNTFPSILCHSEEHLEIS